MKLAKAFRDVGGELSAGQDIPGRQDSTASNEPPITDYDDEFLLVNKVIRRALHVEDSTEKPAYSVLTAQETNKTSFLNSSGSSMLAQSSLRSHAHDSKGTCIDSALLYTNQKLIDAQSSWPYLKMMMTMIAMMAMMAIITRILSARATETSSAIRALMIPAENLVYLLL